MSDIWSKADLHIHSNHSDGLATIPEIMDYVQERHRPRGHRDHRSQHHRRRAVREVPRGHVRLRGRRRRGDLLDAGPHHRPVPRRGRSRRALAGRDRSRASTSRAASRSSRTRSRTGRSVRSASRACGKALNDLAFHALEVYNSSPYLMLANRVAAKIFTGGQGIAATGGSDAHVLRGDRPRATRCSAARPPTTCATSLDNLETYARGREGPAATSTALHVPLPADPPPAVAGTGSAARPASSARHHR